MHQFGQVSVSITWVKLFHFIVRLEQFESLTPGILEHKNEKQKVYFLSHDSFGIVIQADRFCFEQILDSEYTLPFMICAFSPVAYLFRIENSNEEFEKYFESQMPTVPDTYLLRWRSFVRCQCSHSLVYV